MTTLLAQLGVADESASLPSISSTSYTAGPPSYLDITFSASHGLTAGLSHVTLAGFTPSDYNGIHPVVATASATVARIMLGDAYGAVSGSGTATKQVYGSGGAPSRFYRLIKESFKGGDDRVEAKGIRAGAMVMPAGGFQPIPAPGKGGLEFVVEQQKFAWWLEHLVGAVATTSLGSGAYQHASELGLLNGKSFVTQINRPFRGGQPAAFDFEGCKVTDWELRCTKRGLLELAINIAYRNRDLAALAVVSYTAGLEAASYVGSTVTIDGQAVPVHSWSVKVDLGLDGDTSRIMASGLDIEPVHGDDVAVAVEYELDWTSTTVRDIYAAAARADTYVEHVFAARWPTVIGGGIYPSLTATLPAVRLDGEDPQVGGKGVLTQKITGVGLDPETGDSPLQLVYVSADSTP